MHGANRPGWLARAWPVARNTISRTMKDGNIHAGNIAYLSIVTLFPLAILITAAMSLLGRTDVGQLTIVGLLDALPQEAAAILGPVINEVLAVRTGPLLWVGGLVALWTVTRFVETLRDLFHRAYECDLARPAWQYRLFSVGATLLAMVILLIGFISQLVLQIVLKTLREFLAQWIIIPGWMDISRLLPPLVIFGALWALYKLLSPPDFRQTLKWPGALLTTIVWIGSALLMGPIITAFGDMSLTYGALSGLMTTMLFFYIVGMALVMGAQLNAALANANA